MSLLIFRSHFVFHLTVLFRESYQVLQNYSNVTTGKVQWMNWGLH